MKAAKPILIILALISPLFFVTGCSNISKHDKELIENINSKYYSVARQGVNKVAFEYESTKFANLIEGIQTQEVRQLMSKITFIAAWRPYGRLVVDIDLPPN